MAIKRRRGKGAIDTASNLIGLASSIGPHAVQIGKSAKSIYDVIKAGKKPAAKWTDGQDAAASGPAASGRRRRNRKSYHKRKACGLFGRSARVEARVRKRKGNGVPYHAGGSPYHAGRVAKRRRRHYKKRR